MDISISIYHYIHKNYRIILVKLLILVGGLEPWNFMTFHSVGNVIIPTDFCIFLRGWNHQPDYIQKKIKKAKKKQKNANGQVHFFQLFPLFVFPCFPLFSPFILRLCFFGFCWFAFWFFLFFCFFRAFFQVFRKVRISYGLADITLGLIIYIYVNIP